ncbi:MAG: hypothetical protein ACE5OQ_03015 [Woeseia sp.]
MNARESMSHEQAADLLPWLVSDTLDDAEKEIVLEHASACVICRRELDYLRQLRDSIVKTSGSMPMPDPDMRNINARIDALIANRHRGQMLLSMLHEVIASPWRIAFAAQTALLVALVTVLLWPDQKDVEFTTLTQPQVLPNGNYVRVVFGPELDETQLTGLLERYDLAIVNGPSNRGVYTLGVMESLSTEGRDQLVMHLEKDPNVLFAQTVVVGSRQ